MSISEDERNELHSFVLLNCPEKIIESESGHESYKMLGSKNHLEFEDTEKFESTSDNKISSLENLDFKSCDYDSFKSLKEQSLFENLDKEETNLISDNKSENDETFVHMNGLNHDSASKEEHVKNNCEKNEHDSMPILVKTELENDSLYGSDNILNKKAFTDEKNVSESVTDREQEREENKANDNMVTEDIDLLTDERDESDFRVNIIERNTNNDGLVVNEHVEKDCVSNERDEIKGCQENEIGLTDVPVDNQAKEINQDLKEKTEDETDFRVNITERNTNNDVWVANEDVEKDCVSNERKEVLDFEENEVRLNESDPKSQDLKDKLEDEMTEDDETDFRVNIISRDESGDNWTTNQYIDRDDVTVEPSRQYTEAIKTDNDDNKDTEKVVESSQESPPEISDQPPANISLVEDKLSEKLALQALGIRNPQNFRSLNAIIGMLWNCSSFRDKLIEYHNSDQIALIDFMKRQDLNTNDALLINDLCRLFLYLSGNISTEVHSAARMVRRFFENKQKRFEIFNGFNYLLKKINTVSKTISTEHNPYTDKSDIAFFNYKSQNEGFVHDLFYGQLLKKTFCFTCQKVHHEEYVPFKSLFLPISNHGNKGPISLEDCLQEFLSEKEIVKGNIDKCCDNSILKVVKEITHAPKYLFICVDRQMEHGEVNRAFVESDNGIIVNVKDEMMLFSLLCVIDHSYHDTLKCFSDAWWCVDEHSVRKIMGFEIVSEDSCGFMFEKQ